jgi:prolyl-tRNA editing enzyme YbaK/EbsC (Cys-tRNA(Pro) deacylase)
MTVVCEYLKLYGIPYTMFAHKRTETSIAEAIALGVQPGEVVKTLAVTTGVGYAVAVVPASRRIDMHLIRKALDDPHARLATEWEMHRDFRSYALGALPPLGSLIGAETFVDPEVLDHEFVIFAAGSQTASVRVRTKDLFRVERISVVPLTTRHPEPTKELVA